MKTLILMLVLTVVGFSMPQRMERVEEQGRSPLVVANLIDRVVYDFDKEAEELLVKVGGPAVEPLVAAAFWDERTSASARRLGLVEILVRIADSRAIEPLISVAVNHPDELQRALACDTLVTFPDPRALAALLFAFNDPKDYAHCLNAVRPLGKLWRQGSPVMRASVEEILRLALRHRSSSVRHAAVEVLIGNVAMLPDERRVLIEDAFSRFLDAREYENIFDHSKSLIELGLIELVTQACFRDPAAAIRHGKDLAREPALIPILEQSVMTLVRNNKINPLLREELPTLVNPSLAEWAWRQIGAR